MVKIIVEKECGCFKDSEFENNKEFSSKDDALLKAQHMVEYMNNEFCTKHKFHLREEGENLHIGMELKEEEPRKSGCCGGGHCS